MRKLLLIGLKDVRLAFRDRSALTMMLLAPFLLTLGLGFVTGRFSGAGSGGLSDIPVAIVNEDGGQLGDVLVDLFQSDDLNGLILPSLMDSPAAARDAVDANEAAAAIVIPAGFTGSIIPTAGQAPSSTVVQIELYENPGAPTSVGVITSILEDFITRVEIGRVAGQVAVTQLIENGIIRVSDAAQVGASMGARAAADDESRAIALTGVSQSGASIDFDVLAYMAPGMALMFLMFTASYGGRALLAERQQGTLPRLLVSPTTATQVLGGKICGTFLTGLAQVLILIVASTLLFGLKWGDPWGILALTIAAVIAAVSWGMLITAVARTPAQVSWIGSAVMLTFGLLGGSFISLDNMPAWFRLISKITPNAWGLDGFTTLALGGRLPDTLTPILALLAMGAILFILAVVLFGRRDITAE
jgi:ABC-2 type transport system permease protein